MKQFWLAFIMVHFIFMMPLVVVAGNDTLDIQNIGVRIADNKWQWTAFVSGSSDQIAKIECVEYILHPTFPNPIQKVCSTHDPKYPFALTATGWGTFNLRARIKFKDGTSKEVTHYLRF